MYNYNPYNNQFNQGYNSYAQNNYLNELQQMRDKIDKQIQQSQQSQQQPQIMPNSTPTNLTQNFQLAPQQNNNSELESRYAENIDEVKNTFVMKTAIFATKDFGTIWLKDVSGNIRTFKTEEIFEIDEKDIQIQNLQRELEEMKSLMAQSISQNEEIKEAGKQKTTKSK